MKSLVASICFAALVGAVFWFTCGHELRFNVYSGDEFQYDESFSARERLFISLGIGIAASVVAFLFARLFRSVRRARNKHNGTDPA
jgi:hypothetical protein